MEETNLALNQHKKIFYRQSWTLAQTKQLVDPHSILSSQWKMFLYSQVITANLNIKHKYTVFSCVSGILFCIPRYPWQSIVLVFLSLRNMRLDKRLELADLRFEIRSVQLWTHLSCTRITALFFKIQDPDLSKCVLGIPELLQKAFHNLGAQLFGAGKQVVQY